MDYANPPTVFIPQQVTLTRIGRLLPPITQGRRAVLIVNRNPDASDSWLGSDSSVSSTTGFLLAINDSLAVATMAEVWATAGTYHMITLSR